MSLHISRSGSKNLAKPGLIDLLADKITKSREKFTSINLSIGKCAVYSVCYGECTFFFS